MNEVERSAVADEDIRTIAHYIALQSPKNALHFEEELWGTLALVAESPHLGAPISGFKTPLRVVRISRRFRRYLVFYEERHNVVRIVRILHSARNVTKLLNSL